jgi:transposase
VTDTSGLPISEELARARALIVAQREQIERQKQELALLKRELERLARKLFKKKSEKLDPQQLQLILDILSQAPELAQDEGPVEMDSGEVPVPEVRRKRGRRPLPRHLPRRRVLVDLSEAEKRCACGREKRVIGEARSEKLNYVPAVLEVVETVIPKYACPGCHDGVSMAAAPPQAFEKSLAAEGLLAHVVVSKYADHLPLHRQEVIFKRHGIDLPRSTLVGFVAQVAQVLEPIARELKRQVLQSDYLQTDDTSVVILDPDVGDGRFKGHFWTYVDPLSGQVVFDVTPTRERDGPAAFLLEFRGYLQADAYTGYDQLYRGGLRVELACWAHARRYFHEALESDKRAAVILELIQRLYRVEKQAAGSSAEQRRELRRAHARPVLDEIDHERSRLEAEVLPRSPLGEALRYLGNQWAALQRYLDDGRLQIDNNGAERQLRAVAVGRKNWLFAGSMPGAQRAALLYSLVQSCRLADVEPFRYLQDVLLRVASHPHGRIAELTPRGWAKTFGLETRSASA